MKNKGFTLIELLGVIVLLAIIALITTSVTYSVVDKAKKGAFKDSVLGIMESAEIYKAANIDTYQGEEIIFECDGENCINDDGKKLKIKGDIPINGQLIVHEKGKLESYYLRNTEYCALGGKTDLRVFDNVDCSKLDESAPKLEVTKLKVTTNQIMLNVTARDIESGIVKITYEIDGSKVIEDTYDKKGKVKTIKTFEKLKNNQTYDIKITATNDNGLTTTQTLSITTLAINNPTVTMTGTEIENSGYYINHKGQIKFDATNIENPEYFVKTTKIGTSSIPVTQKCGIENEPTVCETIEATTSLEANVWYKVDGNLDVSYPEISIEKGTLYAAIYDGAYYIATTGVIEKTTQAMTYKVNHYQMNLDGSTYALTETEQLTGYVYVDVTPSVKNYGGFTSPSMQILNLLPNTDNVVNYNYKRNQYTLTVNKGTGISAVSGSGTYYYGTSITVGYSLSAGYSFNNWTGDKTSATFTMPASNVTMKANGKANTNTKYVVNHYQMNLDGSTYTLVETQNLTGTTDTIVSPSVRTYQGFTSPSKQSVTILGNGSRVINYYYTRNRYTVTVNKGTGIASVSGSGTYYYGTSVTVGYSLSTGYHFTGWSGTYTSATFTMPASNVTMTANGAANTYTIKYAANSGSGSMSNTTCTYGKDCTLRANAFTRTGYTFNGWTGSDGNSYSNSATVKNLTSTDGGTVTMTAKWKAHTYTIKYAKNGGSGSMSSTTCTYGKDCTLTANAFTKTGYSFNGWTGSDGNSYSNKATVKNLTSTDGATITMTAKWKIKSYTLTIGSTEFNKTVGGYKETNISVTGGGKYEYGEEATIKVTWKRTIETHSYTDPYTYTFTTSFKYKMPAYNVTLDFKNVNTYYKEATLYKDEATTVTKYVFEDTYTTPAADYYIIGAARGDQVLNKNLIQIDGTTKTTEKYATISGKYSKDVVFKGYYSFASTADHDTTNSLYFKVIRVVDSETE